LGGGPAGFNRLIQQLAQLQCFLQRQPGQRMLAMQMANGVMLRLWTSTTTCSRQTAT
jgi:hypothetical protein